MIAKALSFIKDMLNQEMKLSFGIDEDLVIASSLINPDGSVPDGLQNRIVLSIINLEEETGVKALRNHRLGAPNDLTKVSPPVYLNMYLLVSAHYESANYLEANKMLSKAINTFQTNPHFTREKYPVLEAPLERLTLEVYNLPFNEMSHVWSSLGAKYVPSIIYKVRMLTLQEDLIQEEPPLIEGLDEGETANK